MEDSGGRLTGEPGRPHRGRPRDPAVDEAILAAAVDLLGEAGYARLTMEQVAARAGVGKASVYLRWPNKVALVAEAIQHRSGVVPEVPNTGSLREDILLFLRALLRSRSAAAQALSAVSGEVAVTPAPLPELPRTGSGIDVLAGFGGIALALGGLTRFLGRRRPAEG